MQRICFVSLPVYGYFNEDAFDEARGGGAKRQVYLISQELIEFFDVSIVVGDYGQNGVEETGDGISLYRAYDPRRESRPVSLAKLFRAMRRADADCYIYRGNPRKAAFVGLLSEMLGKSWVYHVANDADLGIHYEESSPFVRWLFRREIANARAVVAQTADQRRTLYERFGVKADVVPNGYPPIDERIERPREFFLWVGRITRRQKRPHLFLDCAEKIPGERFVLIGTKEDIDYYEQIARRAEQISNVDFLGSVAPEGIHEYFARAMALVNTSKYEGFPNTFLEAWRHETPVVSLTVDPDRYLHDGVYAGHAGDDLNRLAERLDRLACDPSYRRAIGRELRKHFEDEYDIRSIATTYADILADS